MLLYANITQELTGKDRDDALRVIDDDDAFDRWLKRFQQSQGQAARTPGKQVIDNETYLAKHAVVIGGDDDE